MNKIAFETKRVVYYDVLRIIAIFLVIFNHTHGYMLYSTSSGIKTWGYMFLTMVTRVNVPLFFMISGALLFRKQNEEIGTILKDRVLRFLVIILFANTMVYLAHNGGLASVYGLVNGTLSGTIEGSYWYLYAYLGMLLMLPYLRKAVVNLSEKDFIYFLVLHFLFASVIPIVNYFLQGAYNITIVLNGHIKLPYMLEKAFFFPIMGYYLDTVDLKRMKKKHSIILIGAMLLGIFIS